MGKRTGNTCVAEGTNGQIEDVLLVLHRVEVTEYSVPKAWKR